MKKLSISLAMVLAVSGSLGCSESLEEGLLGLANEWVDSTETDPMTDEVTKSISYTSFDGLHVQVSCLKAKGQFGPTLAIRISPRADFLRQDFDSMMVRIDEGEVHSHAEPLWAGRPASALIDEMSDGEVMLVRIVRHDRSVDHAISLDGFKARLSTVLSFCARYPRSESLPTRK